MAKVLNPLEAKFVAFLISDPEQNATQAAMKAGYSPKSCAQIGYQNLKKPKIIAELDKWRASKRQEITKDDYVDMAMKEFRSIDDPCEPNKPRYLDLVGKALKFTTSEPAQAITNNTLNVLNVGSLSLDQLRHSVRGMIAEQ